MTADEVPAADETGKIRGAETARRTVRVLTALAARQPIGLDELAKVVGLNKNTTYRLLRVLQEEGYSERLPQGGYRLGPAAAALSSDRPPAAGAPRRNGPQMPRCPRAASRRPGRRCRSSPRSPARRSPCTGWQATWRWCARAWKASGTPFSCPVCLVTAGQFPSFPDRVLNRC